MLTLFVCADSFGASRYQANNIFLSRTSLGWLSTCWIWLTETVTTRIICVAGLSFLVLVSLKFSKFDPHSHLKWCCTAAQSFSPRDSVFHMSFPDLLADRKIFTMWSLLKKMIEVLLHPLHLFIQGYNVCVYIFFIYCFFCWHSWLWYLKSEYVY